MGIAENGFRELTNSVREVKSVDDMKNLKSVLPVPTFLWNAIRDGAQMQPT